MTPGRTSLRSRRARGSSGRGADRGVAFSRIRCIADHWITSSACTTFDVLKERAEYIRPLRPVAYAPGDTPCNELLFGCCARGCTLRRARRARTYAGNRDAREPPRGARWRHSRRHDEPARSGFRSRARAPAEDGCWRTSRRRSRRSRARVSIVENHRQGFDRLLATLHARIGRGWRVGITVLPARGRAPHRGARRVVSEPVERGVIAVDPTRRSRRRYSSTAFAWKRSRWTPACSSAPWPRGARSAARRGDRLSADVLDAFGTAGSSSRRGVDRASAILAQRRQHRRGPRARIGRFDPDAKAGLMGSPNLRREQGRSSRSDRIATSWSDARTRSGETLKNVPAITACSSGAP